MVNSKINIINSILFFIFLSFVTKKIK